MIDLGRLGMLDIDRDIALSPAVDLAAGGGHVDPVGHVAVLELVNEFVHHRLDHPGCIRTGDITVQPSLGMGNHRQGILGPPDHETRLLQRIDQGLNPGRVIDKIFNV